MPAEWKVKLSFVRYVFATKLFELSKTLFLGKLETNNVVGVLFGLLKIIVIIRNIRNERREAVNLNCPM